MLKFSKKFFVILAALILVGPLTAKAQDIGGITMCALVVPCDSKGELLPVFSHPSPCLSEYQKECVNARANLKQANIKSCTMKLSKRHIPAKKAYKLCQAKELVKKTK